MSLTDVECFSSKYNGYDYVDLGLSVKWAAQNIGAVSFGDFGDVYMWGELHPKDDEKSKKCLESQEYWDLLTYMVGNDFRNVLPSELKRIQELTGCRTYGVHIENISANHTYDVARANYGGEWRIPTNREWQELIEMCSWIECIQDDFKGAKVTSKVNGNTLLLPYSNDGMGLGAAYWSANSLWKKSSWRYDVWRFHMTYALYFDSFDAKNGVIRPCFTWHTKDFALPIRPIF